MGVVYWALMSSKGFPMGTYWPLPSLQGSGLRAPVLKVVYIELTPLPYLEVHGASNWFRNFMYDPVLNPLSMVC